jgi:hypothetical protein
MQQSGRGTLIRKKNMTMAFRDETLKHPTEKAAACAINTIVYRYFEDHLSKYTMTGSRRRKALQQAAP